MKLPAPHRRKTPFGVVPVPLVPVTLVGPGGRLRVKILFDSGAEVTILPQSAARLLGLPRAGPGRD